MPSEVILPRVDMDMATGKISKWLVADGTPVRKGQPLFEIETDKAAMEIEAEASGTLRTLAQAGAEDLAVGSVVAWIFREGEGESAPQPAPAVPAAAEPAAAPPALVSAPAPVATPDEARARATPLARRMARERGHTLDGLVGTGPRGRVQAADVPAAAAMQAVLRDAPTDVPAAMAAPAIAAAPAAAAPALATRPTPPPVPAAPQGTPARGPAPAGLATLREGQGAPLVLVHGFGADRDGWRPFLQGYGGGRPVLALDLPGHGTAPLEGGADFDALVDAVEATLTGARLSPFTLVGHSLGGAVAAAVAARGTLDLAALLLVAPAGLGPEINGRFVEGFLDAGSEASLAPWLRELVADPSLVTPAFVRATLKAREPALAGQRRVAEGVFPYGTQAFSIRADLARIACPVRVVVGTADRIVPARHADGLPGRVALHRLAGIGHMPQIEAREDLLAILAQTVGA